MKKIIVILLLATAYFALPISAQQVFDNGGAPITTPVTVKANSGNLQGWHILNFTDGPVCFLQIFNAPSSSVILGTTVPEMTVGSISGTNQAAVSIPMSIKFSTAISIAATTTPNGATTCIASGGRSGIIVNIWFN